MTNLNITYKTVDVPAYGPFVNGETLHVATVCDGLVTSGLCRTPEEARSRIEAYAAGSQPPTEAPDYHLNTREMMILRVKMERVTLKDGGVCARAIEAALRAGLHTVEWAIASRYWDRLSPL